MVTWIKGSHEPRRERKPEVGELKWKQKKRDNNQIKDSIGDEAKQTTKERLMGIIFICENESKMKMMKVRDNNLNHRANTLKLVVGVRVGA